MVAPADTQAEMAPAEAAQAAFAHIRYLSEQIGPRPVGSESDAAAARYVQQRLAEAGVRELRRQDFVAPRSVWMPFAVAAAVALLGVGLWILSKGTALGAYLGALGCGFALWEVYAELNFGWSPLAAFIPKVHSQNIIASIAPTEGEGRNAVVFAHLDTQRTPIFSRSKTALTVWLILFYVTLAALSITLLVFVVSWFADQRLPTWLGIPVIVLGLPTLALMIHSDFTPYSRGANDNASSVGVALALARQFTVRPMRNTRLWIVFTSGEETGCHGASAFLQEYGDELMQGYTISLECLGVEKPAYSTREGMLRSYRSNSELLRLAAAVARDNPTLGLRPVSLRAGYTEAGMSVKRGYRALALVGTDRRGAVPYWHSPKDTTDKISDEPLAAAYTATATILRRLDDLPISIKLSQVKPLRERS
ncbi:MAG: M28 family metallopeptidase [Anaerolineae bacterium]